MASEPFTPRETALIHSLVYRTVVSGDSVVRASEKLGISRNYAHSLLARARSAGHIEVTVHGLGQALPEALVQQVHEVFAPHGVRTVIVAPSGPPEAPDAADSIYRYVLRTLAATAADHLEFTKGATICLGGGRRMLELVGQLASRLRIGPQASLTARPLLVRPRARLSHIVDNDTVLHALRAHLADAAEVRVLTPALLPHENLKRALERPMVAAAFGSDAPQPSVCILDVASVPDLRPARPPLEKRHTNPDFREYFRLVTECVWLLDHEARRAFNASMIAAPLPQQHRHAAEQLLRDHGVVGGFNGYGLDAHGAVVEDHIERVALAVHPHTLRDWAKEGTEVVVLANGSSATRAVEAVARGGYCTTLIIDAAIALRLLGERHGTTEA